MNFRHPISVFVLLPLFLTGCLTETDDTQTSGPSSEAVGMYSGTTSSNRSIDGIILNDGTYYFLYSYIGNPSVIAGVVQGNSTTSGGTFSSSNAVDFNIEGFGILNGDVSASYQAGQSVNGTISYDLTSSVTFSSTYNTDFDITPSLSDIAGTYSGSVAFSLGFESASLTISSNGAISGFGSSGCAVSGSITPNSSGNVYDVTISFGGSPCYFANQTQSGIGYYDATAKRVWSATPNASRTEGIIFVGTKP